MSSETSAEMCRRKADECRHGAAQARSPDEEANWLQVAEEWQAVAEKIDVTNAALSPLSTDVCLEPAKLTARDGPQPTRIHFEGRPHPSPWREYR
jgi:hypothetical protein